MIDLKQNIVKRRPRPDAMKGAEWAIVYLPHNKMHPFVVCTLTPDTLANSEWVHGRYHENFENANRDYACRPDVETDEPSQAWKLLEKVNANLAERLIEEFRLGSELIDITAPEIIKMVMEINQESGDAA